MTSVSPAWQRIAVIGICASAALFVGGSAWQLVGTLAPVLGLFFGGWLLSCVLEPVVGGLMRIGHMSRSSAVLSTFGIVLLRFVVTCGALGPAITVQMDEAMARLPATLNDAAQGISAAQTAANALLAERASVLGWTSRLDLPWNRWLGRWSLPRCCLWS